MELNDPVMVHWVDWDLLLRLGVAAVIGLLLGIDREMRDKAAGLRTHGILCFTAAAMTVSAIALFHQTGGSQSDVLRIYEASGSFIGIIGAGLIVFSKGRVQNLTTAAHLWLTAVIGIACGAAQWPLVAFCVAISVVMLTLLGIVEARMMPKALEDSEAETEGAGQKALDRPEQLPR